ncbi:hypothetical protein BH24ACT5_BH24ACT5_07920 [soil metagenome]
MGEHRDATDRPHHSRPGRPGHERVRAGLVAVAAVGAVLFPMTRDRAGDSLPLSNYPMFTSDQPEVAWFYRAVGVTTGGDEVTLPPELSGGTVEVIHALKAIARAVDSGTVDQLCVEIAQRTAVAQPDVETVIVVRERYDVEDALVATDPEPARRRVLAHCRVR